MTGTLVHRAHMYNDAGRTVCYWIYMRNEGVSRVQISRPADSRYHSPNVEQK